MYWRNYISEILGNRLYQELYSKRKSSIIKEFGSLKQCCLRKQQKENTDRERDRVHVSNLLAI